MGALSASNSPSALSAQPVGPARHTIALVIAFSQVLPPLAVTLKKRRKITANILGPCFLLAKVSSRHNLLSFPLNGIKIILAIYSDYGRSLPASFSPNIAKDFPTEAEALHTESQLLP